MRDRALADIGDDLHVGVGMGGKARVRRDLVVIPHPQRAMAHVGGIVMAAEREVMLCLQPAVIGAAEVCKGSEFDHGIFLIGLNFYGGARRTAPGFGGCLDQAPKPPSTLSTVPVTNDASGLGRNTTPAAISSAVAKRSSPCWVRWASANSRSSSGFMSVLMEPGCSTFTVMPRGPRSRD